MDGDKEPKRRGRPPKNAAVPKSGSFTFRLRPDMRARLQASAESRGRSISEDIESRLELSLDMEFDPFKTFALRMIVEQWRMIDALTVNSLSGDELYSYGSVAKKAVDAAVTLAIDPAFSSRATSERIKLFFGSVRKRELDGAEERYSREDLEEIADNLIEGNKSAIEDTAIWDFVTSGPDPEKKTKAEREEEAKAAAARKADPRLVSLTPEQMDEQMGPPGQRFLQPKRGRKSQTEG